MECEESTSIEPEHFYRVVAHECSKRPRGTGVCLGFVTAVLRILHDTMRKRTERLSAVARRSTVRVNGFQKPLPLTFQQLSISPIACSISRILLPPLMFGIYSSENKEKRSLSQPSPQTPAAFCRIGTSDAFCGCCYSKHGST